MIQKQKKTEYKIYLPKYSNIIHEKKKLLMMFIFFGTYFSMITSCSSAYFFFVFVIVVFTKSKNDEASYMVKLYGLRIFKKNVFFSKNKSHMIQIIERTKEFRARISNVYMFEWTKKKTFEIFFRCVKIWNRS